MVKRNRNVLIITLYSAGMIGSLVGLTLMYSSGFELLEQKYNRKFPPVAVIHKSQPLSPVRLYRKKMDGLNLYLFISEISLSMMLAPILYKYIENIIKKYSITDIIVLSSIADVNYNYVTNIPEIEGILEGMSPIKEGAIGGVLALLLPKIHSEIRYLAIFSPSSTKNNIDIDMSIALIRKFKDIFTKLFNVNLDLDTSILESYRKRDIENVKLDMPKENNIYR